MPSAGPAGRPARRRAMRSAGWLSPEEAATEAGVHRATIYRWMKNNSLHSKTVGGNRFVSRASLDQATKSEADREFAVGPVVHGMRHGYPLCGFQNVPARQWPRGHKWSGDPKLFTCPGCRSRSPA